MTITFESDQDVIVYALEKIIAFARNHQHIFLAQSVWWISSIIGLQEGLVIHIDNLRSREEVIIAKEVPTTVDEEIPTSEAVIHLSRIHQIQCSEDSYVESEVESDSTTETNIHNEVIDNCELFLEQSKQERKALGRRNRQVSRVVKRKAKKEAKRKLKTFGTQTEGIEGSELRRRKAAGECQRCAWPQDRKGSHKTLDCIRWKRVEKGTAPFPKNTRYNKN
jgi:hypothetical protein